MGFYDNEIKRVCTNNPRLLILAINSIFKKKHSLSAKVVFLDKEQNSGDSEDTTFLDSLIEIESNKYHMEFQLLEGNMAIRMYEYAVKETIKEFSSNSNHDDKQCRYEINVIMPEQTVIFLAGANKKDYIMVNMTLPDRQMVSYKLPCISASMSVDELCEKDLYILLPFQQVQLNDKMNHISRRGEKAKLQISKELFEYHLCVRDKLEKLLSDGILTLDEHNCLIETFSNIEMYLVGKDTFVNSEVIRMGDKDYVAWSDRVREEGIEQGIEQGKEQGLEQGIKIFIIDKLEDKVDEGIILEKLEKKFNLSKEKALGYFTKYRGMN